MQTTWILTACITIHSSYFLLNILNHQCYSCVITWQVTESLMANLCFICFQNRPRLTSQVQYMTGTGAHIPTQTVCFKPSACLIIRQELLSRAFFSHSLHNFFLLCVYAPKCNIMNVFQERLSKRMRHYPHLYDSLCVTM